MSPIGSVLSVVSAWAASRGDVVALALVGSHARGTAAADSDIDLVVLTPSPSAFRESAWLTQIPWAALDCDVAEYRDAEYGAVWSRHVTLDNETLVEFSFADPTWAATAPCDPGTRAVVQAGCCPLYDPEGLLHALVRYAA